MLSATAGFINAHAGMSHYEKHSNTLNICVLIFIHALFHWIQNLVQDSKVLPYYRHSGVSVWQCAYYCFSIFKYQPVSLSRTKEYSNFNAFSLLTSISKPWIQVLPLFINCNTILFFPRFFLFYWIAMEKKYLHREKIHLGWAFHPRLRRHPWTWGRAQGIVLIQ